MTTAKSQFDLPEKLDYQSPFEEKNEQVENIVFGGLFNYTKMLDTYGEKHLLTRLFNANSIWDDYLKTTFVNTKNGDTLDATENGKYYNVVTTIEAAELPSDNIYGVTRIEFLDRQEKWTEFEKLPGSNTDPLLRVKVEINTAIAQGTEGLNTIIHEIVLHAERRAKQIAAYLDNKITLLDFKSNYIKSLAKGEKNDGHRELVLGSNPIFNSINAEMAVLFDKFYPNPRVLKIKNYRQIDYAFSILTSSNDDMYYEYRIPWSDVYKSNILTERNSYANIFMGSVRDTFNQQTMAEQNKVYDGVLVK